MKLLFTCVGRRVELLQNFRRAAEGIGVDLQIVGTDISESAPAMQICDKTFIVPRIRDSKYIPTLMDICAQEEVDAVIPTIDTDLLLLSKNRSAFSLQGTHVIVSHESSIGICRDKMKTALFFRQAGVNTPTVTDDENYQGGFPAFIKPKDGSSSVFAYRVNNEEELKEYMKRVPQFIVQPYISGTEYTVDVLCDWEGAPLYITPRIRLEVRAGEVLKSQICQDQQIIDEVMRLVQAFKPCGPITIQLIRERQTGLDWFIEINPRFGGGAPISMMAGADSATAILRMLQGQHLEYTPFAACDGALYSRYDQSMRIK